MASQSVVHKLLTIIILMTVIFQQGNAKQQYFYPRQQLQQLLMQENYDNSQELNNNNDFMKIVPNDPNFLSNWPYLRELLPPSNANDNNYEASTNRILDIIENRNLIDEIPEMLPTPQPLHRVPPMQRNSLKDQTQKKNSNSAAKKEYMHACHFKICNMGRKRNARFNIY